MQQLLDVRERMRSVTGIGEVCRTLSTVAAAKLAQTRERAVGVRDYTEVLRSMAARQQKAATARGISPVELSPLMEARDKGRVLVFVVGADRGLCGGYNVGVGRAAKRLLRELDDAGVVREVSVLGLRAESYIRKTTGTSVGTARQWTRAGVSGQLVDELLEEFTEAFTSGQVDEVWAVYTSFVSAIQRQPRFVRLLPIAPVEETADPGDEIAWCFDPAQEACVAELLQALVRLQVEGVLLESYASEQAARMVTMQEASERADRALQELRVRYNRLRRESITSDLTGVLVAGRMRKAVQHDA